MDPHQVSATAQTDAAKAVIRAVVSAFYNDVCVIVVDLLLRPPYFLREGPGMGPRALHLPTKTVRKTLAFLQRECLVACETVRGIVETVSSTRAYRRQKAAQFWYIDLNRAVWSVTLRLHALRQQLEHDVVRLQTTSRYECPGYRTGACNGHYTELEIQDLPVKGGQFLCHECHDEHKNNPEPPPVSSYTLVEVDQTHELRAAETKLRRFQVQCQERHDGTQQLRPSLFALLQKVHQTTRALRGQPVTSLLPSEHGAEEHVAPPSDQPAEPLVYAEEAADERAGLLQVRGWNNQLLLLDVESSASASTATAAYWARRGGVPFLAAPPLQQGGVKNDCDRDRAPPSIPERPSKAPCRQTTPFFLRDSFTQKFRQQQQQQGGAVAAAAAADGWDESLVVQVFHGDNASDTANNNDAVVSNVVQRTRGLSIEEDDDNNDNGGDGHNDDMGGLFDTESTTHSFPLWVMRDGVGVGDNSGPPTNDNNEAQQHCGNRDEDTAREIARAWRHGLGVESSAGEGNDRTQTAVARLGRSHSFPPRTSFLASESSYASVEWEG